MPYKIFLAFICARFFLRIKVRIVDYIRNMELNRGVFNVIMIMKRQGGGYGIF